MGEITIKGEEKTFGVTIKHCLNCNANLMGVLIHKNVSNYIVQYMHAQHYIDYISTKQCVLFISTFINNPTTYKAVHNAVINQKIHDITRKYI